MEIAALYEKRTGNHIDAVFGNMQQILSQTETSGKVSVVFGEKSFLNRSTLVFSSFHPVGKGTLVSGERELKLKRLEEIRGKEVQRLGMPDPEKAIYGQAATEYLKKSGLRAVSVGQAHDPFDGSAGFGLPCLRGNRCRFYQYYR